MNEVAERKAFEALISSIPGWSGTKSPARKPGGRYYSREVNMAWEVWKLRARQRIDYPNEQGDNDPLP